MTEGDCCHGENGNEIRDLPVVWHEGCDSEDDHAGNTDDREEHRELESFQHLGHFNEEVGELDFLRRSAP